MDKKIIFIHKSEILAHGFHTILNSSFNMDLIHIKDIESLNAYSEIHSSFILFIVDINLKDQIDKLNLFKTNNIIDLLWFSNCEPSDDTSFYAFSSGEEVRSKVSIILKRHKLYEKFSECTRDLSERELDVLKLVACGFSNREIGKKLFISIHTVISHRKNITEKLGIKSISGLTVYAILNKLIDPTDIA
jgi:DNA-binding CsgD family transcriptional regulator